MTTYRFGSQRAVVCSLLVLIAIPVSSLSCVRLHPLVIYQYSCYRIPKYNLSPCAIDAPPGS